MDYAVLKTVLEKTQEEVDHRLDWLLDLLNEGEPLPEDAILVAAIALMNRRFKKITSVAGMERVEILRGLDVFRIPQEKGIAAYATEEEFDFIIHYVAEAIVVQANEVKPNCLKKLGWIDIQKPMVTAMHEKYPELFTKIMKDIHHDNMVSNIRQMIDNWERHSQRFISARISSESEYAELIAVIEKDHSAIVEKIEALEFKDELKATLLEEARLMLSSNLAFASLKYDEEPTRLLYSSSGRGITVKVKLPKKGSCSYHKGHKVDVKWNTGEDASAYPLIISLGYLDDFLCVNNVRHADIWIDPESVGQFYLHGKTASVRLTPKFIANWFNIDCPVLKRCVPNKHYGQTLIGFVPHFENNLVEMSWSATYVDNDVTEEEMQAFADYREDSSVTKQMRNVIEGRQLLKDGKYDAILEAVTLFDQTVQSVIDAHMDEIQNRLFEAYPKRIKEKYADDGSFERVIDDNFGLDCGFTNIFTTDSQYKQNRNLLKTMNDSHFFWMGVNLPIFSQSITFNRTQFSIVKDIVMREKQIDLYANFQLD